MGDFPVRYDSSVVIYDRRGFIRLATGYGRCIALARYFFQQNIFPQNVEFQVLKGGGNSIHQFSSCALVPDLDNLLKKRSKAETFKKCHFSTLVGNIFDLQ